MIYGYARVSTRGQARDGNSLEVQEQLLKQNGAEIIYVDTFTGTKMERPKLNELLNQLQSGDTMVVTKLDRIARSIIQGSQIVNDLIQREIKVNILNVGMLDNTPTSKLIRNIFFSFAEFERDMIFERTQEGKEIARQNPNYREGRLPKFKKAQIELALKLLKQHTYREVETMTGISISTLIRAKRKQRELTKL